MPKPLLTPDQVELLRSDNVVSEAAQAEGRTLSGLGIDPVAMEGGGAILSLALPQGRAVRGSRGVTGAQEWRVASRLPATIRYSPFAIRPS